VGDDTMVNGVGFRGACVLNVLAVGGDGVESAVGYGW
jgi:hypothetical protein